MKTLLSRFSIWEAFSILAMLNVIDAATTAILVHQYGASIEANPIVRYWIELYGVTGLYMIKFVVVATLGLVVKILVAKYPDTRAHKSAYNCIWLLNILLGAIVINNTIIVVASINI